MRIRGTRRYRHLVLLAGMTLLLGGAFPPAPRVFLIGDSTMADKPLTGNPERGWGQVFPLFLKEGIAVENHARNGRSTKSFLREGRWAAVREKLQPGDYVLIQFGHNDAKKDDTTRYAEARTDYRANLLTFVRETRARGAMPVLITPVVRRRFDAQGKFFDVHGEYPGVVRELGEQEQVQVIDLQRKSMELVERLGELESKTLFLHVPPGIHSALGKGKTDDTHFCWRGAAAMAGLVANEIRSQGRALSDLLGTGAPLPFVGMGKRVLLDCYYNNEWRTSPSGTTERFHYVWDDTTNSGFSQLAGIVSRIGADLDTLNTAPSRATLNNAAVYVIVDPDTPKESPDPHVIGAEAAEAIEQWVRDGGTLILLGNDRGNAEFEHLNGLAERFGIHFNEDSRNRVTGREYDTGTFKNLPSHPMFAGVRRIFIKELSTLRLQAPAQAILTEGNDVIVAVATPGKGRVVAVGDPWFYNEYMDARRLPAGYDNALTAENLFRWVLSGAAEGRR